VTQYQRSRQKKKPFSKFASDVLKPDTISNNWEISSVAILGRICRNSECNAYKALPKLNLPKIESKLQEFDRLAEITASEIVDKAIEIAGKDLVGTDHLLLAILATPSSLACQFLTRIDTSISTACRNQIDLMKREE
jgi:hypothetical protein